IVSQSYSLHDALPILTCGLRLDLRVVLLHSCGSLPAIRRRRGRQPSVACPPPNAHSSCDNVPIGYDRFCRQGAQKTETRRQLPDASTTSLQDVADLGYAACRVVVDLEVPESQRYPTRIFEHSINPTVSLLGGRDLTFTEFA